MSAHQSPKNTPDFESRLPPPEAREAALYEKLSALGITWKTHAHGPVFTVEEARSLKGVLPGTHTKNLFLKDKKDGLFLVSTREDVRVDLNALARLLNRPRFSFGAPELLLETLRIAPGAVTPFSLMNDRDARVRAVFDAGMLVHDSINFHPLRNDRTTAISASDLMRFARDTHHELLVLALP